MPGPGGIVVALAGGAGSGKSTVGRVLADRLGGEVASFGDYVRHLAGQRGAGGERHILQQIGQESVEADPARFVSDFLEWIAPTNVRPLVLDGVRHLAIDETLRRWAAEVSRGYMLVLIDTPLEKRAERRSSGSLIEIRRIDGHAVEREAAETLPAVAELIVDGNGTVEDVVERILARARKPLAARMR